MIEEEQFNNEVFLNQYLNKKINAFLVAAKKVFLPLDFESTKAGRPAPAAHRMPIAEAQTAAGAKLPAADHRADERKTDDAPATAGRRRPAEQLQRFLRRRK